ncbi:presenilins-associated rhomboid-like protein, mitochondrial isoform X3 [Sipha flava]|uniref:rhomboid protease n=1 Tax=Sipha flava TaxID=143950 RepID=A0A8B8FMB9_9HEMI|nr:presenilins-associated rhomboid-like protein, mitochondrial isoform X3 [Sipha flava]
MQSYGKDDQIDLKNDGLFKSVVKILNQKFSYVIYQYLRKIFLLENHLINHLDIKIYFRGMQVLFSNQLFFVSSGAIVLAAIIQYERLQSNAKIHSRLQNLYNISKFGQQKTGVISEIKSRWNNLKPSEKIFGTILVLNSLVFFAWQVPRWQHIMVKYFSTDALANKIPVSSLLFSAFSHSSSVHLAFNMYALFTFCRGVIHPWGKLGPEEFTAFYISSCVVSSLVSIVFRRSMKSPGISLGASGAILSVVGYFALSHPEEKLSVIFLPMIQFDAIYALFGLVTVDSLGILLGWKMFDHAAHLGGTLFGMFWYKYMSKYVWGNRRYVVRNWIALKKLVDVQSRK